MSIFAESDIYTLLNNTSDVTDLLDTYTDSGDNTRYGIFNDMVIPKYFTGDNSILYYQDGLVSGVQYYMATNYSINCRARKNKESKDIAKAVFDTMNRYNIGSVSFVCEVLGTIQPADSTDLYNTPVSVQAVKRSL